MNFKTNKYILIPLIGTILCMIAIFMFSAQTTTESNNNSKKVVNQIVDTTSVQLGKAGMSENQKTDLIEKVNIVARELMHAAIFFVLSIFAFIAALNIFKKKRLSIFITLGFCIVYAVTDEIHQLFVDGRTTQLLDVIMDTVGASIAIVFVMLVYIIRRKAI